MSPGGGVDFDSVEMEDSGRRSVRVKVPRRTIYFASGETMEEYSTDEDEQEQAMTKKDVVTVDPSKLTWGPYFWFHLWRAATSTISVCDYMGEKLASLFGITTPKYQYAIDEYYRVKKEEEEEEEENRLGEAAQQHFEEQQRSDYEGESVPACALAVEQPAPSGASFVNVSFEMELEAPSQATDSSRVPPPLSS
ncbi:protein FAM177A1 isoform X2 [Thalassophryne amazonica]|uniref:protein FAM177A1 isoform X2 n=1 Tax=Thalassophryne amazonica TaxID=390379 RepID=UPI0014715820|nr:protein FAM177A1 isoform X2 [Thalassophryne amazonica]